MPNPEVSATDAERAEYVVWRRRFEAADSLFAIAHDAGVTPSSCVVGILVAGGHIPTDHPARVGKAKEAGLERKGDGDACNVTYRVLVKLST